jgi:hypothetical protein
MARLKVYASASCAAPGASYAGGSAAIAANDFARVGEVVRVQRQDAHRRSSVTSLTALVTAATVTPTTTEEAALIVGTSPGGNERGAAHAAAAAAA